MEAEGTIAGDDKSNIALWKKRCNDIPANEDIYEAIYNTEDSIRYIHNNSFVEYLKKHGDKDAIAYIDFAKRCNIYNQFFDDPWERHEAARIPKREALITEALTKLASLKDEDIKSRYAFIAIRLAYYNGNSKLINTVYDQYFAHRKSKNIIDYWALYFNTIIQHKTALANYQAAIVFANALEKRFMISLQYDRNIPIDKTLAFAKNNKEKAAIWLLDGTKNPARAMGSIENIYKLDPQNEGLNFLILREINKLEDWIFTPYYTNYPPSLVDEDISQQMLQARIESDRAYAKELLSFLQNMHSKRNQDLLFIKMSTAYLLYITNDYSSCLSSINSIQKKFHPDGKALKQLNIVKALCITAQQQKGKAIIPDEIKPILMQEYVAKNYKFVFALARELEFKGNTSDAAMLLSKFSSHEDWISDIYWKAKRKKDLRYEDFHTEYFTYLDIEYTTGEIKELIKQIENTNGKNSFEVWKMQDIKTDLPLLYDLLGTKHVRLNDLSNASKYFGKVNDTLWKSSKFRFDYYLNANPFYTNFYAGHQPTKADTVSFTKRQIIDRLNEYLHKAQDVHNKDRDYYYFQVANCYLNMSEYGNSWMMRRYYWTSTLSHTDFPDDKDYLTCNYAQHYYLKAKEVSKNKEFAALCLRMAGRCEKYRLMMVKDADEYDDYDEAIFKANKYYRQLKNQYPAYYDELISNCESFEKYSNARR